MLDLLLDPLLTPSLKWVGSCIYPDTDSRRGSLNDAAMFALCCGPQSC